MLTQVTLEMSRVFKTTVKKELHISTLLKLMRLCPTGIQVNNSDTTIYVHWNGTIK